MNHQVKSFVIAAAIGLAAVGAMSGFVSASPDAGPDTAEISASAGAASTASDAGPAAAPAADAAATPEPGSNDDLREKLADLEKRYEAVKNAEPKKKRLPIAAFIGSITWLLISGIKRTKKMTKKGKRWLPWVALALGPIAGFFDYYALGSGFWNALITGGGPPLAVLAQELLGVARKE